MTDLNQDEAYADQLGELQSFCSKVYERSPRALPVIQRDVDQVVERARMSFRVRATLRRGPSGHLDLLHLVRLS